MKIRVIIEAEPMQLTHESGKPVSWIILWHSNDLDITGKKVDDIIKSTQAAINRAKAVNDADKKQATL